MEGDIAAKPGADLDARAAATADAGSSVSLRHRSDEAQEALHRTQNTESLVRLTGGVAHDFNNLLTVIIGNATALRLDAEARGDTKGIQRAERIERAAERGGRLAGQLLAFSRNQTLRPESLSAYSALSALYELLAQAAGDTVRIRLLADKDVWNCRIDPGQLDSAILNLVLNSRDAMPIGGSITISCHNEVMSPAQVPDQATGARDYVRIDVTDTGTGIAPDLLDKVFEPI